MVIFTGFPARGSRLWRLILFLPKGSAAISSRSRHMRANFCARCKSPMLRRSPASRLLFRSTKSRAPTTRAQPWRRSPKFMTTCASCMRAWASRTAWSAAARSKKLSTKRLSRAYRDVSAKSRAPKKTKKVMGVEINEDTVRIFAPVVVGRKGEYYQLALRPLGQRV
jgi:disulfide oxidoreductase YuzD